MVGGMTGAVVGAVRLMAGWLKFSGLAGSRSAISTVHFDF